MTARAYTRIEIADAQMNAAIDLYLAGDYVPAITLAGVASELYGASTAPPKGRSDAPDLRAHKQDADAFAAVYRHLHDEEHPRPFDVVNLTKNRMKHVGSDQPDHVMEAEDEAYWYLDQANRNRELDAQVTRALDRGYHPRTAEIDAKHAREVLDRERRDRS